MGLTARRNKVISWKTDSLSSKILEYKNEKKMAMNKEIRKKRKFEIQEKDDKKIYSFYWKKIEFWNFSG